MNLQLLARILTETWALRREHLSMFTQLVIGGGKPHHPSLPKPGVDASLEPQASTTKKVWTWDGPVMLQATEGYEIFNTEGWVASEQDRLPEVPENVTVLLVWGVLGRAWTETDRWWFDPIDVDDLAKAVTETPDGSTVVLWFRSPGGISSGIPETAEVLRKAGKTRRIIAFTDDLCASAAYWLAAQCESIFATPTADVGSIGVYIAFYDWCEYLQKAGIKLELFKAGELKAMGMPGNPLNAAERAHLDARVQSCYRAFTADVTRNREIASEHMQGQTLQGSEAKGARLVNGFYPSAAAFLENLGNGKV